MISLSSRRSPYGLRPLFRLTMAMLTFLTLILPETGAAMTKKPPHNRFFIKGETVFLATCTAKPTGSVCQIRNTGTTLDGVNLYIDAGSVTDPIEVQVSLNTGYLRLHDGTVYKNPIIEIMIDKNAKLKHPIKIAIPISLGEDSDPISGFFIKDDGSLSAVVSTPSVTYEDKIRRFSIYTFHSGMFTWIGGRL